MRQKLSASKVEALYRRPESSSETDGGGLYFRKRRKSASWVIRRSRDKLVSYTTIGRYPQVRLAQARKILKKFGSDSVEDKTVADLLQDWFDQNHTEWRRPEQMEGYIRRLTADDPRLVAMNIHVVGLVTVRNSLKNYACKHGNVAANRLMEILKQVFKHAVQVGYLQYSPIASLRRSRRQAIVDWECESAVLLAHLRENELRGARMRKRIRNNNLVHVRKVA